jgi:starch phosphorylase
MAIARYMYHGVDVWLNNPRRPQEASGTSGMKVLANGGLNFSILDGWWAEGYSPSVGWAIGSGEEYPENEWEMQDQIESEALYNILENDIIPLFYDRRDGLPRNWITKMKNSMAELTPFFNTRRMVREYTEDYYIPTFHRVQKLTNPLDNGKKLVGWIEKVQQNWGNIGVGEIDIRENEIKVGSDTTITAKVYLNDLSPEDVVVQVYYGQLDARGEISEEDGQTIDMTPSTTRESDGAYIFKAQLAYDSSGERGLSVRILPNNEFLAGPFQLGLIKWA